MRKNKKKGQSLVEFLLTMVAFLAITFMFVQLALSMGVANYIQYATFLSSRAYLSGAKSQTNQTLAASSVLERMLYKNGGEDRFKAILKASDTDSQSPLKGSMIGGPRITKNVVAETRTKNWEQGVTYRFKARLYMIPLIKASNSADSNAIELESQSWLGREPTTEECQSYMNPEGHGPSGSPRKQINRVFLTDNGC